MEIFKFPEYFFVGSFLGIANENFRACLVGLSLLLLFVNFIINSCKIFENFSKGHKS
jgi:hypothetical protein